MRLIEIVLHNIRSYRDVRIPFEKGITLLTGDIGSGKSTILLGIEFALFGTRRGEIGGADLLRHGANEGSVTLTFSLGNADERRVTIHRPLKRAAAITQDAGYLIVDGRKESLTPIELRARILELIGYPEELVRETRSLLFRYTVYTPQEQMKQILYEKPEERNETFRRLFGIDKYRLMRENAATYARGLKERAERSAGQADDLSRVEEARRSNEDALKTLVANESLLKEKLLKTEARLKDAREANERFLLREREANRLTAQLNIVREKERQNAERLREIEQDRTQASKRIEDEQFLPRDEIERRANVLAAERERYGVELREIRSLREQVVKKESRYELVLHQAKEQEGEIRTLTVCPTCRQEVGEEHKCRIGEEARVKSDAAQAQLVKLRIEREGLEARQRAAEILERDIQEKEREVLKERTRLSAVEMLKKALVQLEERHAGAVKEQSSIKESVLKAEAAIATSTPFKETEAQEARKALVTAEHEHKEASVALARHEEQLRAAREQETRLARDIEEKRTAKARAERLFLRHTWLTRHFTNVMSTIESAILAGLYHAFNDAFREYFAMLLDDEQLSVRLDEALSPVIEQDGYETTVEHLSGGERTSVALAYRLAINSVVNAQLGIGTRDLLILDEPTEGFSSEQLDRVQEVLRRLPAKQLLIVSHEPKMVSCVDHVLHVVKRSHESALMEN